MSIEGPIGHGGTGTVVRQALNHAVARTAVRTVDEWVAVAAVGGVEELAQAVVAGRDVGGNERTATGRGAGRNRERRVADHLEAFRGDAVDPGERRRLVV